MAELNEATSIKTTEWLAVADNATWLKLKPQ